METELALPEFGELLRREYLLDGPALSRARELQEKSGLSLARVLVDTGAIEEHEKNFLLQKFYGFELISLRDAVIQPALLRRIPQPFAHKHHMVIIGELGDQSLIVAMEDPSDQLLLNLLEDRLGHPVRPVLAARAELLRIIDSYADEGAGGPDGLAAAAEPAGGGSGGLGTILMLGAVLLPLVLVLLGIRYDWQGLSIWLNRRLNDGLFSHVDLVVTISVTWILWTLVVFELRGLLGARAPASAD